VAASLFDGLCYLRLIVLEFVSLQYQKSVNRLKLLIFVTFCFLFNLLLYAFYHVFCILYWRILIVHYKLSESCVSLLHGWRRVNFSFSTWITSTFFGARLGCVTTVSTKFGCINFDCVLIFLHDLVHVFIIQLLVLWNLLFCGLVIFKQHLIKLLLYLAHWFLCWFGYDGFVIYFLQGEQVMLHVAELHSQFQQFVLTFPLYF